MEGHYFLSIDDYGLSNEHAKRELNRILGTYGITNFNSHSEITLEYKGEKRKVTYTDLLKEVRISGYIQEYQQSIDAKDPIWSNAMNGISSDCPWPITFNLVYAGYTNEKTQMPGRLMTVELDISNDILYYRREACENSNTPDHEVTSRCYRAYLFNCISLVEAFINRHILQFEHDNLRSDTFTKLKESDGIAERLELLYTLGQNNDISVLKSSVPWCIFMELKDARNTIVHTKTPYFGLELREVPDVFNKVKMGIGELLGLVMANQGKEPVSFVKKLAAAPLVRYVDQLHE